MLHYLPMFSTLVTFAFALVVLVRYARRGGTHLLLWGIGLGLYGIGTFAEAWLFFAYDPFWLKLWYLTGAVLNVGWLGQGTVHLLVRRKGVAPALTAALAVISVFAVYWIFQLPVTATPYHLDLPVTAQYKDILVRGDIAPLLVAGFSFYGTAMLAGGALYSAYIFWRKRVLPNRVLGNVLITAGALFPAMSGVLIKRGLGDYLFVGELLGASIMFVGFLVATSAIALVKETPVVQAVRG